MKRRTARELEDSKLRARIRRRRLLGWPECRLMDPPRAYGVPRPPRVRLEPVQIVSYDPHPLVDEAIALMRSHERAELGGEMDAIALDLIGAYCLGELACGDGRTALEAERTRNGRDRKWLVYGTSTTTGLER